MCLGSAWRASRAVAEQTVQDQQRTAELARFGTAIVPGHHIRKGGHSDEAGELRFERLTKALLAGGSEQLTFKLMTAPNLPTPYSTIVDSDAMGMGAIAECLEMNNTGTLGAVTCPQVH